MIVSLTWPCSGQNNDEFNTFLSNFDKHIPKVQNVDVRKSRPSLSVVTVDFGGLMT